MSKIIGAIVGYLIWLLAVGGCAFFYLVPANQWLGVFSNFLVVYGTFQVFGLILYGAVLVGIFAGEFKLNVFDEFRKKSKFGLTHFLVFGSALVCGITGHWLLFSLYLSSLVLSVILYTAVEYRITQEKDSKNA